MKPVQKLQTRSKSNKKSELDWKLKTYGWVSDCKEKGMFTWTFEARWHVTSLYGKTGGNLKKGASFFIKQAGV